MRDAGDDAPVIVDVRGMRCPWPALQAARAMRSHARITLIADDPKAEGEVRALAGQHGWAVDVQPHASVSVALTLSA